MFPLKNLTFNRLSEPNSNVLLCSSYNVALHLGGSVRHIIKASSLNYCVGALWKTSDDEAGGNERLDSVQIVLDDLQAQKKQCFGKIST